MAIKYLAFAGENYYPMGGFDDFAGAYDTLDDALTGVMNAHRCQWWHIAMTDGQSYTMKLSSRDRNFDLQTWASARRAIELSLQYDFL